MAERLDVISLHLFGNIVSFAKDEFDLIIGFRLHMRNVLGVEKPPRLRSLYFKDNMRKKQIEAENQILALEFKSDADVVNVTFAYFIELVTMGREKKQKFDASLLGIVDDWKFL